MASYRVDRVSDSDSDHTAEYNTEEEELQPGPSKKSKSAKAKRVPGAASYRTKFNKAWTKNWAFVQAVPENAHSFYCTVCRKNIPCQYAPKLHQK